MQLELRGITKRFPGVIANDNVNLTLKTGEVLCLIGENGAGKSTLMNVLYGMYKADEGQIILDGAPVVFMSPADAIAAGIVYFVSQICKLNISKRDVKNVSETSEVTINKCFKKLEKISKDDNIIPAAILKKYNLEHV